MFGWEKFHILQLVGFFFSVVGTLIYNEIIVPPYDIFRKNTKAYLEEKAEIEDYLFNSAELGYDDEVEPDDDDHTTRTHVGGSLEDDEDRKLMRRAKGKKRNHSKQSIREQN